MKKILSLLAAILFVASAYAQSVDNTTVNKKLDLNKNETYWYRAKPLVDTVSTSDTLWSYTFGIDNLYDANKQYLVLQLDSVSGTPSTSITWSGKVFVDDSWTTISTVTWSGTTSDTTLIIDQSTAKHYRFYRLLHDGTGTFKYSIAKQELQLYK